MCSAVLVESSRAVETEVFVAVHVQCGAGIESILSGPAAAAVPDVQFWRGVGAAVLIEVSGAAGAGETIADVFGDTGGAGERAAVKRVEGISSAAGDVAD